MGLKGESWGQAQKAITDWNKEKGGGSMRGICMGLGIETGQGPKWFHSVCLQGFLLVLFIWD